MFYVADALIPHLFFFICTFIYRQPVHLFTDNTFECKAATALEITFFFLFKKKKIATNNVRKRNQRRIKLVSIC